MILTGWQSKAFILGFVGCTLGALYPIIFSPMKDPSYYKKLQKEGRKHIKQEEIQPGNMKVWSDPFSKPRE